MAADGSPDAVRKGADQATRMAQLLRRIDACRLCARFLPLGPRPVLQASATARLLIMSQAPGRRVHLSGIPFDDPSGARLREWLGITSEAFYDAARVAIVPMGFCYPGKGPSGDLPPRPECAPTWHPKLLPLMPDVELTLLIGGYAQNARLGRRRSLTDNCRAWREHLSEGIFPLPHPSPRNQGWFKYNPWFFAEAIPELQRRVASLMARATSSPEPVPPQDRRR